MPGGTDEGLGTEVVDFVEAHGDYAGYVGGVGEVALVEGDAGIKVEELEVFEVGGVAADETVDLVVFGEEEVGEIGAILAGDASDEGAHGGFLGLLEVAAEEPRGFGVVFLFFGEEVACGGIGGGFLGGFGGEEGQLFVVEGQDFQDLGVFGCLFGGGVDGEGGVEGGEGGLVR